MDAKAIQLIQKKIEANPYVKSTTYISKEEIKKQLIEDLGGDPEEALGYDPSPSYFDVFIKSDYVNTDSIKKVEASFKEFKLGKRSFVQGRGYCKSK